MSGLGINEVVDQANSIPNGSIGAENIALLSINPLGMVKENHTGGFVYITFDSLKRAVFDNDRKVDLSPNESLYFGYQISNPSRLITYQEIVEQIFSDSESKNTPPEFCRPIISRLRSKLKTFEGGDEGIEAIGGGEDMSFGEDDIGWLVLSFIPRLRHTPSMVISKISCIIIA